MQLEELKKNTDLKKTAAAPAPALPSDQLTEIRKV